MHVTGVTVENGLVRNNVSFTGKERKEYLANLFKGEDHFVRNSALAAGTGAAAAGAYTKNLKLAAIGAAATTATYWAARTLAGQLNKKPAVETAEVKTSAVKEKEKPVDPKLIKEVYVFGEGGGLGIKEGKKLQGGKGYYLGEMTRMDIPVPPGLTITTAMCNEYMKNNNTMPKGLLDKTYAALTQVENKMGKKYGDINNPLLLSVRSGAPISMPGMMDTVMDLGLNDEIVEGFAKKTNNPRLAQDNYRRLIQMYGKVVLEINEHKFEHVLDSVKAKYGAKTDQDLSVEALKDVVKGYKELVKQETGKDFPQDPKVQLEQSIEAVFRSWNTPRAIAYRKDQKIDNTMGTAVNVQAMVFGNVGDSSGSGVVLSRNNGTGKDELVGDYVINGQGEEVVSGTRNTKPIAELEKEMPEIYAQLHKIVKNLESHNKDAQDCEFTIEQNDKGDPVLWILQTRAAKRTAQASLKIAINLVNDGIVSKEDALLNLVDANRVKELLLPIFDVSAKKAALKEGRLLGKGINASPGAGTGMIVFSADEAAKLGSEPVDPNKPEGAKKSIILVRPETSPDDVHGMLVSKGILTSRGGKTSHAALVATAKGLPCVAGCDDLDISLKNETVTVKKTGQVFKKGDIISIDGTTGEVISGAVKTIPPEISDDLKTIINWAKEYKQIQARANADTPSDAQKALELGAEGIGLCRTERMFNDADRLPVFQSMIMADTPEARKAVLDQLEPIQRKDFYEILKVMQGKPVTVRLLDPPLHEFVAPLEAPLNKERADLKAQIQAKGEVPELTAKLEDVEKKLARVESLREANPMIGTRGARLLLTYPEIGRMQVKALIEAACDLKKEGIDARPEIMIPNVSFANELIKIKEDVDNTAQQVMKDKGVQVDYKFGTMIESPRAAFVADQLASIPGVVFSSFGTNDLTQATCAMSRDDCLEIIGKYTNDGIIPADPTETIDKEGVGEVMKVAVKKAKSAHPGFHMSICGEHGGEEKSVKFCNEIGMDCASSSPFRVPVTIISAAQGAIAKAKENQK